MKHLLTILFCFFTMIFFCVVHAQKVHISGKLTGKVAKVVAENISKEVQIIGDGTLQKIPINIETLTFEKDIKILEPQFVEIKCGNNKAQYFYIVTGDTIDLILDKPSVQESIITINRGKTKELQELFSEYFKALEKQGIDLTARDWDKLLFINQKPLAYAEEALHKAIKSNGQLMEAIPNFKQDMELFIMLFRNYVRIDDMHLEEIEQNLERIRNINLKKGALNIPFFKEYINDLANAYAGLTFEKYGLKFDAIKQKHIKEFVAAEAIQKNIINPTVKSYFFAEKLNIELVVNGLKNENFVNFLLNNSEPYVNDFYKERIAKLKDTKAIPKGTVRKKAFAFQLQDAAGKTYTLNDFKGKMLFIDFWASWCAPCKAQMPYQKDLEKMYADKNIVFANVSLDTDKTAWLKAVKAEGLHGAVLHADKAFQNDFPKAYSINAIPRYMLIDAEGNIISDNMPKPQNVKEVTEIIDAELYAKNVDGILAKHFAAIGANLITNTGLTFNYKQSLPGFSISGTTNYTYPNKLKFTVKFDENPQMITMLGESYFKERYIIKNGNNVAGNLTTGGDINKNWHNKIFGFELFLKKNIDSATVEYLENTTIDNDTYFVVKISSKNGAVEKYFINKKTYLIDKIVIVSNNNARQGGGFIESFIKYSDYKNVNGIIIPHAINQNNIIQMKVDAVLVKTINENVYTIQ